MNVASGIDIRATDFLDIGSFFEGVETDNGSLNFSFVIFQQLCNCFISKGFISIVTFALSFYTSTGIADLKKVETRKLKTDLILPHGIAKCPFHAHLQIA